MVPNCISLVKASDTTATKGKIKSLFTQRTCGFEKQSNQRGSSKDTACICELQPDSQRWRHHRNLGKRKKLQYFFQFKHFSIFSNKIGADFIQTNSKISFWNDILKKKNFQFWNFVINVWFILRQNFFFNKDCSKVKDKKNLLHKLEDIAWKRHTVVKIFTNPPPFGAGRIEC